MSGSSGSLRRKVWLGALLVQLACEPEPANPSPASQHATASGAPSSAKHVTRGALGSAELRRLIRELNEPDRGFISDNYVSNETSYLDVVPLLSKRHPGGVYIGVGPEQNFTYLAALRPELAFIVDIRRDNLLLHLLYKAMFELSESRVQFLCLWLARDCSAARSPGVQASVEQVVAAVSQQPAPSASFDRAHRRLLDRLERVHGFQLSDADRDALARVHRAFHRTGFEMTFKLKKKSARRYPTLRELLVARDPHGGSTGFLGSEQRYRVVRRLQRENRVVFVIGDFAGEHALASVAREMKRRGLELNAFYVSNVEQYLLGERATWRRWMDNLENLPGGSESLVIRAYLDQGKRHPLQQAGHRTATLAQHWSLVKRQRERHRASLLALSSEAVLNDADR